MNSAHLLRLREIVDNNKWQGLDRYYDPRKSVEDLLSELIEVMSDAEADLTLDLIEDYLLIPEYGTKIWPLLDSLEKAAVTRAILCPVKLKGHVATKSGQNLIYDLQAALIRYPALDYQLRDDPLGPHYLTSDRTRVAVDDFIGSGEQFSQMVDEIHDEEPNVHIEHLLVLAIQDSARQVIEAGGVQVHALHTRPRALHSLAAKTGRSAADVYAIYDAIEARVPPAPLHARGFLATEALITLKRTPDNTLPIFWETAGGKWPAPFPR